MLELLTSHFSLLLISGFIIGVFSVVIGGGMFFSMPLMQWLFPQASFGVLMGNIKVGSFFRSIGSTISTFQEIEFIQNFKISFIAFIGTIVGASLIASASQAWVFPAVIIAIIMALYAPKIATKISDKTFGVAAFITGLYAGAFGAGIGIMLIALIRLKHPKDTDIAHVKIQARFVEWLLVVSAILTHMYHRNIVSEIWVPWAIGGIIGGYVGGILLKKLGKLSGSIQKYVLYAAFAAALLVAGYKAFFF